MSVSQFNDSLVRPMFSFTEEQLKATEVYLDDVKFVEENLEFTDEEKLYMSFHLSPEDAELYKRLVCNFKVRRHHRSMEADYVEEEWPNMTPEYDMDAIEKQWKMQWKKQWKRNRSAKRAIPSMLTISFTCQDCGQLMVWHTFTRSITCKKKAKPWFTKPGAASNKTLFSTSLS